MKKNITTLLFILVTSIAFSQSYYMYDFRSVPDEELATMIENEEHFWSKVAQDQIKKGNMTGWAMLQRMGGTADEPNILFFIGAGSKENIDKLGASFGEGTNNILDAMGESASVFINRGLAIPSRRVGQVVLNRVHTEFDSDWSHHNFVKTNFAKVSNIAKMNELQGKVWGKYIKKMMDRNETSQKLWSASNLVSPNGNGYGWNYLTIDTYMSYGDVLDGGWAKTPSIPDLSEINSLMGGQFFKQVTWRVLMSVNREGKFRKH
ncbi:MAG: hypothetical protein EBY37_06850 [Flavobacteriia bacterium]|nr:hypothetical protein [Flavobacteriia bacterium]